jgi:hypothetical protein
MKQTEIQLSNPFEEVLASVLALPSVLANFDQIGFAGATNSELRQSARCDAEVKEALHSLYEAAHGRQVETPIGFLPIAPPVADFLKEKPYYVATQHDFFLEAFTRILVGDSARKGQAHRPYTPDSKRARNSSGTNGHRRHTRTVNGSVLLCRTSPRFTRNHELRPYD